MRYCRQHASLQQRAEQLGAAAVVCLPHNLEGARAALLARLHVTHGVDLRRQPGEDVGELLRHLVSVRPKDVHVQLADDNREDRTWEHSKHCIHE